MAGLDPDKDVVADTEVVEVDEETTEVEVELDTSDDTPVDPIEAIAREGGWSPIENWRGDKEQWKDAETFIREGIKIQGKQHDKIDRLQESIKGVEQTMRKMAETEAQRTRKALEAQKARLAAKRQEAFDRSDAEGFESVESELKETDAALSELDTQANAAEEFERTFKERNKWYQEDKAMTAFALQSAASLRAAFDDMPEKEFMTELERIVKAQFPNEFENPNRAAGSMAGADRPSAKEPINGGKKKTFDSLPQEAKEAFQELNQYMPANAKMTKAAYVKSYFEEIA